MMTKAAIPKNKSLRRVDKINITIVEIKRKVYTIDYCKENQFMDAYKIGKLIAKKRKELHLTQQALADQLSVTNKAISKWERGVSQTKGY